MNDITNKFLEKVLFFRNFVATEDMKMLYYTNMLRDDIQVIETTRCKTLNMMTKIACVREGLVWNHG